jgi:hypothetical protein
MHNEHTDVQTLEILPPKTQRQSHPPITPSAYASQSLGLASLQSVAIEIDRPSNAKEPRLARNNVIHIDDDGLSALDASANDHSS